MKIYDKEFLEKDFEKSYAKINEFLDVPGVFELRDLLVSFRTNEQYIFVSENIHCDIYDVAKKYKKKVNLLQVAAKGLGIIYTSFISKSKISWESFIAVYSIVLYSCCANFKRDLTDDECGMILKSDLVYRLTLGLDNWQKVNNSSQYHLDKSFFKNLLKIKWSKKAKQIDKAVYDGYFESLMLEYGMDGKVCVEFAISVDYLSCCYAVADNRNEILAEDVAAAWLLILNLFLADLRSYIFEGDY